MFSPCRTTLSSLALSVVPIPWRSFIALIDYFPNLRNLKLESLSFVDDNTNPSPLSRPLRGRLCFYICQKDYFVAFSDWFTGLEVEYEELVVDAGYVTGMYSQRIVTTCERSLKRLKFGLRESAVSRPMLQTLTNPNLSPSSGHPDKSPSLFEAPRTGTLRVVPNGETPSHHLFHHLRGHSANHFFATFFG